MPGAGITNEADEGVGGRGGRGGGRGKGSLEEIRGISELFLLRSLLFCLVALGGEFGVFILLIG